MQTAQALEQLEALYTAYCETADRLEHSHRIFEGMLGLGGGPTSDPSHARFREDVGALLVAFAAGGPDSAAAREVLSFLLEKPQQTRAPKTAYWTLIAVQGQMGELIGALSKEDAAALTARFQELYPRRARLPVQDAVLKRLQKAAK